MLTFTAIFPKKMYNLLQKSVITSLLSETIDHEIQIYTAWEIGYIFIP